MLEPAYELATEEAQKRIKEHGYVSDLYGAAKRLGYEVLTYRLFPPFSNPLNPTGLMIIKKGEITKPNQKPAFSCPVTKSLLQDIENVYFSKDSMLAYPVIQGIPCLLPQNAIIATHFLDVV